MANKKDSMDRRRFLKGAAVGAAAGAAAIATTPVAAAAKPAEPLRLTAEESAALQERETAPLPVEVNPLVVANPGSDFMVDVLKSLNIEYIAANPASSSRGLHESLLCYGGNKNPEWLTCTHEEVSVNMSNGYYAVEGRPMAIMTFAPSGLLHAGMAIHGAWQGHTPTFLMVSNIIDAMQRRPGVDWGGHSMMDAAAPYRDILKWDDTPVSLQHFADSAVRAYKMAMTEPRGPVMLVVDDGLQEHPVPEGAKLHVPRLTLPSPPAVDPVAVEEVAKLLVAAESPLIVAGDVARDEQGMNLLVELAETLQAPVQGGGRGMPNRHPLAGTGFDIRNADVVLGLNKGGLFSTLNTSRDQEIKSSVRRTKDGAKIIDVSSYQLYMKSNFQDVDRYAEVDMALPGDPQATLPSLIEACKKLITSDRRVAFDARGKKLADASAQSLEKLRTECTYAWDASPISQLRLSAEVWDVIKHKDWASVGVSGGRLWNEDKFYRTMGEANGGGIGGALSIAVGASLAHKKHGRFCVAFQADGDMMYVPGALWTATHHRIPLLLIMHNNHAYHQEIMHLQRMANRRQRGQDAAHAGSVGTVIRDPNIDFAQLARSLGAYSEGPITNPNDFRPALLRAVERVDKGEVALLDTWVQPR